MFATSHGSFCAQDSVIGVAMKETDIGHQMEYLLATGNLRSRSGLGLQQVIVQFRSDM